MPSAWTIAYQRDAQGRISGITATPPGSTTAQTIVSAVNWNPFGAVQSLTFGNGVAETLATDTDYRINLVKVLPPAAAALLKRLLAWKGETLDSITDKAVPAQSQSLMYSPTHRLTAASGAYGRLAWTYDPVGNRTSEMAAGTASTYAYPANSTQLVSITPAGGAARSFTYDAAGNILTDSVGPGGNPTTYTFDEEGRLATATLTANPTETTAYLYDAKDRLVTRVLSHSSAPKQTILYLYDTHDHLIAETDAWGASQREYVWLDDRPVTIIPRISSACA